MHRRLFLVSVLIAALFSVSGASGPTARAAAPSPEALAPKLRSFSYNTDTTAITQTSGPTAVLTGLARAGEIATGDVDGDGLVDTVIGSGSSGGIVEVREADGNNHTFRPFGPSYVGGVTVAVGDLANTPTAEIVVGKGAGGGQVAVFDAVGTPVGSAFTPYGATFDEGVRVAVGDTEGDGGPADIVTAPGPGHGPEIKILTPAGVTKTTFMAYAPSFQGGVSIAVANLDGDPVWEVVTGPGAGGGPHVRVFETTSPQGGGFFAFDPALATGIRVSAGTVDGAPTIAVTGRPAAVPTLRLFNPAGTALGVPKAVDGADGDLAVTVRNGEVLTADAAPRIIAVAPVTVADHTRNPLTVYGAGLADIADDLRIGTDLDDLVVAGAPVSADDIDLQVNVPAGTGAGPQRLTIAGAAGSITRENFLAVGARSQPLVPLVTTGAATGGGPHVRQFDDTGARGGGFMAGLATLGSGVRVARGDLTGDGIDEIVTGPGPGVRPEVKVYDTAGTFIRSFDAYDPGFLGGVFVAVGDIDGDGANEIVTGPGAGGGPHVRRFSAAGAPLSPGFFAYGGFSGGVHVATGDVDGDGAQEIITGPGAGGGPHVQAFFGNGERVLSFMAYDPGFTGGVYVAGVDLDGEAVDEIVTGPGAGGGPHVRIFSDGLPAGGGFMAFTPGFSGGVSVARVGDDIVGPNAIAVGAGPGGGPHVKLVNATGQEIDGFYAYDPRFLGGVLVAGGLATES